MTTLKASGPVSSASHGQIIENLDISAANGNAVAITHDNVTLRSCRVRHREGNGIVVTGDGVTLENIDVINASPPSGIDTETSADERINVKTNGARNLTVKKVRVRDGSSGFYLYGSPGAKIIDTEGYNFRGPMSRGQFIQFNRSPESLVERFYTNNDPKNSHPEDNVSIFRSPNVTIRDGLIVGNNSVSGVGIMFENSSTGGRVSDVDCVGMGNGAFSSYVGDVHFTRCRAFDSIYADQGRGPSASGALNFNLSASGIHLYDCYVVRPGRNNIVWKQSNAAVLEVTRDDTLQPMAEPVSLVFPWEDGAEPAPTPEPEPKPEPEPTPDDPAPTTDLTPRVDANAAAIKALAVRMAAMEAWSSSGPGRK